jgi:hypothetical protein
VLTRDAVCRRLSTVSFAMQLRAVCCRSMGQLILKKREAAVEDKTDKARHKTHIVFLVLCWRVLHSTAVVGGRGPACKVFDAHESRSCRNDVTLPVPWLRLDVFVWCTFVNVCVCIVCFLARPPTQLSLTLCCTSTQSELPAVARYRELTIARRRARLRAARDASNGTINIINSSIRSSLPAC